MAKKNKAKSAPPYIQRVLEDEFVQEQLRTAVTGARAVYARTRKQRSQVVEDKGLYRNLRQAATALQKAASALRPPEPEPQHRGRKFATIGLIIGATAFVTMKLQKQYTQQASDKGTSGPSTNSSASAATERRSPQPQSAGVETRG